MQTCRARGIDCENHYYKQALNHASNGNMTDLVLVEVL